MPLNEFYCKLCRKKVNFKPDEVHIKAKTKTSNELFGELFTYRVAHRISPTLSHVNVVVYDSNGEYRGHRDAYEEKMVPTSKSWQEFIEMFPPEWREYLDPCSEENRQLLTSFFVEKPQTVDDWRDKLIAFIRNNNQSDYLTWLTGIICETSMFQEKFWNSVEIDKPLTKILALYSLAQQSLDKKAISKLSSISLKEYPIVVQVTHLVMLAELYLQTSDYSKLKKLYKEYGNKWKDNDEFWVRTQYFILTAFIANSKIQQGLLDEALELAFESYQFTILFGNRIATLKIGKIYTQILQITGDIEEADEVLDVIEDAAAELGYKRQLLQLQSMNAIISLQKGAYNRALTILKKCKSELVHINDLHFESQYYANLASTYLALKKWKLAESSAKKALGLKVLKSPQDVPVLTTLLRIAHIRNDLQLLQEIENIIRKNYRNKGRRKKSPIETLFDAELRATKYDINGKSEKSIIHFEKAAEIASLNQFLVRAAVIHQLLAELFWKKYSQTESSEDWRESYDQLNLAEKASKDSNYIVGITSALIMKTYLLQKMKMYDRAEDIIDEVSYLAKKINDRKILTEIKKLQKKAVIHDIEKAFGRLRVIHGVSSIETSSESNIIKGIYALLVLIPKNNYFETFITPATVGSPEKVHFWEGYLSAFEILWPLLSPIAKEKELQNIQSDESKISVVIEQSDDIQIVVFLSRESYRIRVSARQIINQLKNFKFKNVEEELSFFVKQQLVINGLGYLQIHKKEENDNEE